MIRRRYPPSGAVYELRRSPEGSFQDLRPRHRPVATMALTSLIVLVYLGQLSQPSLTARFATEWKAVLDGGEWWRVVTGSLLHGGPLHIAANAYFGWSIGARVERHVGALRLLAISAAAGLGTGGLVVLAHQNALGFSGVLFGWLASWLGFHLTTRFPGLRLSGAQSRAYFSLLCANLLISLIPGISLVGHLGGFVAGLLVSLALGARSHPLHPLEG